MKKLTASEAIAEAAKRGEPKELSKEALAELRKLCEHNDRQIGTRNRVSYQIAIEILNSYGAHVHTFRGLNAMCARVLGRKSYSTP